MKIGIKNFMRVGVKFPYKTRKTINKISFVIYSNFLVEQKNLNLYILLKNKKT